MREAKQVLVIYGYYSKIARSNYRECAQRYVSEKREKGKQERTDRSTTGFYTDASTHTAVCMLMYAEMS